MKNREQPIDSFPAFIEMHNLYKSYPEADGERIVLQGASAAIQKGEYTAVIGKSGSGKSTLLNLISGIDLVDAGDICIDGENVTRLKERQRTLFRRNNIGFVFQFFNLISTLTVLENVTLPLELNGMQLRDARAKAYDLLHAVGLADRGDTFPDRLSGGEQQRVAIARALVNDPAILLADEPTGNLDEEIGGQVLNLLDHLTRKSGKNLIMVTHSLEAASYADRIYCLREGKLISECKDEIPRI